MYIKSWFFITRCLCSHKLVFFSRSNQISFLFGSIFRQLLRILYRFVSYLPIVLSCYLLLLWRIHNLSATFQAHFLYFPVFTLIFLFFIASIAKGFPNVVLDVQIKPCKLIQACFWTLISFQNWFSTWKYYFHVFLWLTSISLSLFLHLGWAFPLNV